MIALLSIILLTPLNAISYRAGGMSKKQAKKEWKWFPLYLVDGNTRDIFGVISIISWCYFFTPKVEWYLYLISAVLVKAAYTTYWDWTGKDNFGLHGFGIGMALLPLAYGNGMLVEIVARAIVLGVLMDIYCKVVAYINPKGRDYWEELGRGSLTIITLIILMEGFLEWCLSFLS